MSPVKSVKFLQVPNSDDRDTFLEQARSVWRKAHPETSRGGGREPRRDVFAHFEREVLKSFSEERYQSVHSQWAKARSRRDAFLNEYTLLEKQIGNMHVMVRPQLGRDPCRLELIVKIPEGVTAKQIKDAAPKIASWRENLTMFQGPSAFTGIENLVKVRKRRDGKYSLEHSEPHLISESFNQKLAHLLSNAEYFRTDTPPDNPPFNSEWCLSEARELFSAWKFAQSKQDSWMKKCLQRIRSGESPFETIQTRNGFSRLNGPFTARLVSARIRSWKRRKRMI